MLMVRLLDSVFDPLCICVCMFNSVRMVLRNIHIKVCIEINFLILENYIRKAQTSQKRKRSEGLPTQTMRGQQNKQLIFFFYSTSQAITTTEKYCKYPTCAGYHA